MIRKLLYKYFPNIVEDIQRNAIEIWMKEKIKERAFNVERMHSIYEDDDRIYEFGITKVTNR